MSSWSVCQLVHCRLSHEHTHILLRGYCNQILSLIVKKADSVQIVGTSLPLLWTMELLPNNSTDNKFCAGEFDLGCIGISTSLHLAEVVADMAIDVTKAAKKDRTENNRGDDLA